MRRCQGLAADQDAWPRWRKVDLAAFLDVLALLGDPMWAGMAWAMIVGLSLSTGLTVVVVPTIYATCVKVIRMRIA